MLAKLSSSQRRASRSDSNRPSATVVCIVDTLPRGLASPTLAGVSNLGGRESGVLFEIPGVIVVFKEVTSGEGFLLLGPGWRGVLFLGGLGGGFLFSETGLSSFRGVHYIAIPMLELMTCSYSKARRTDEQSS